MTFLEVIVRQAHPGGERGAYESFADKLNGAREYKSLENLAWPVLVDDLSGTVHRAYSREMADPSFVIDVEGHVSFYCMWTHVPTLAEAIAELLANGGRAASVGGGADRTPHLLASFVDGYRGPRRGGRRAVLEYDLGGLGAGTLSFLGNKLKPVLAPLALRSRPLGKPL